MRRLAVGAVSVVFVGGAALLLVGWLRPPGHTATTQAIYPAPQQAVWDTLTAFERWSVWYPEISHVTTLPERDGNRRILITGEWGEVPTELTVWLPPHRLRTEMDQGTFSGSWTWELMSVPEGTLVTVTESGKISNPIFRALMIFNDNAASMLAFHAALADRLGVQVRPAVIRE